jgi:uncharacterized protein
MSVRFVIDPLDFVRTARVHHGNMSPAEFKRLKNHLFDHYGEIIFTVSGLLDNNNKSILQIVIKGEINLSCQRCLGKLVQSLNLKTVLVLVKNETELGLYDEDDKVDSILATSKMDVLLQIEDEIILSLSSSSRHQENECSTKELIGSNRTTNIDLSKHPFSILEELKRLH